MEVWPSLSTPEKSKMVFLQQFPLRPSLLTGLLKPHDSTNTWTNHFCFPTQSHPVPAWCLQNSRSSFAALSHTTWLHTACSSSWFSLQHGTGSHCSPSQPRGWQGPSLWPKLDTWGRYPPSYLQELHQLVVTSTSSTHSPRQELTHQFHS